MTLVSPVRWRSLQYFKSAIKCKPIFITLTLKLSTAETQEILQKMAASTTKINPLDFSNLEDTLAKEKTRKTYKREWVSFIQFSGLNEDSKPTEELYTNYLKFRRSAGICGNTVQTILSILSTMTVHFYNLKVDKVRFYFIKHWQRSI